MPIYRGTLVPHLLEGLAVCGPCQEDVQATLAVSDGTDYTCPRDSSHFRQPADLADDVAATYAVARLSRDDTRDLLKVGSEEDVAECWAALNPDQQRKMIDALFTVAFVPASDVPDALPVRVDPKHR